MACTAWSPWRVWGTHRLQPDLACQSPSMSFVVYGGCMPRMMPIGTTDPQHRTDKL